MIGLRRAICAAVPAAVALLALSAQGAMAATFEPVTNTFAYTCSLSSLTREFTDGHCDHFNSASSSGWKRTEIPNGTPTEIEITNEHTANNTTESAPADLHITLVGGEITITATTIHGTGTLENTAAEGARGTVTVNYTGITVDQPEHCEVEEPIKVEAKFHGVEDVVIQMMGMKFESLVVGGAFFELKFKVSATCALSGQTLKVKGSVVATGNGTETEAHGSGATSVFSPAEGMQELKLGGNPAEFTSTTTTKMVGGNPITFTTH